MKTYWWVVTGAAVAAGLGALVYVTGTTDPLRAQYDRVHAGMTESDVQRAIGEVGTAGFPEDLMGVYLPVAGERYTLAHPDDEERVRYWRDRGGLVVVGFHPDGTIARKTYLAR